MQPVQSEKKRKVDKARARTQRFEDLSNPESSVSMRMEGEMEGEGLLVCPKAQVARDERVIGRVVIDAKTEREQMCEKTQLELWSRSRSGFNISTCV